MVIFFLVWTTFPSLSVVYVSFKTSFFAHPQCKQIASSRKTIYIHDSFFKIDRPPFSFIHFLFYYLYIRPSAISGCTFSSSARGSSVTQMKGNLARTYAYTHPDETWSNFSYGIVNTWTMSVRYSKK